MADPPCTHVLIANGSICVNIFPIYLTRNP